MVPLDMPLKEASVLLAKLGFEPWLKAHGKMNRPEISKKQELELRECFELIDSGGSGAISTHDVPLAFSVLGMDVMRPEIEAAVHQINGANKRSMEFPQFKRLMLLKLDKMPVDEYAPSDSGKNASSEYTLPFALLAQAYRRKKLIEAVMGGDKPLQDRMNYRSDKSFRERKALREVTAGPKKEAKGNWSMTLEPTEREKKRAKAASLKKHPKPELPEPALPSYLVEHMGSDVTELLLEEKRKDIIKAALDSEVKFVPPTNKSIEIDQPLSGHGGSNFSNIQLIAHLMACSVGLTLSNGRDEQDNKLSKAYLREKLETFRTDIRHKPTMKKQVIHVQALKSLRDYYQKGSMQVKGSPLLYPASRRPTVW